MRPRILLADDTKSILIGSRDIIEMEMGYKVEVVEAENGREAINEIRQRQSNQFHAVLTDFDMPLEHGLTVATFAFEAKVPHVILFTARELNELIMGFGAEKVRALQSKGLKILRKPFEYDVFISTVVDPLRKYNNE